jgi:hypothetical protein
LEEADASYSPIIHARIRLKYDSFAFPVKEQAGRHRSILRIDERPSAVGVIATLHLRAVRRIGTENGSAAQLGCHIVGGVSSSSLVVQGFLGNSIAFPFRNGIDCIPQKCHCHDPLRLIFSRQFLRTLIER